MKSITSSWIKRILLLCVVFFISYALYLNSLVNAEFSSDIESIEDVIQVQYSFDDYPKDLVNMLLLVEDQSFFNHCRYLRALIRMDNKSYFIMSH